MRSRVRRGMAFCFILSVLVSCAGVGHAREASHWSTAWAAAMLRAPVPANAVRPDTQYAPKLAGQTLRQWVMLSAGGRRIRVRLSNVFGDRPLRIAAASVGKRAENSDVLNASTLRALRFAGRKSVVIPAGAVRDSDPVDLPVRAGETLGISLYVADAATASTWHPDARRTNQISPPGDHLGAATMPVASTTGAWLWLTGVDVQTNRPLPVLVAFGDSITNGFRSTSGATRNYPHALARRLHELQPACRMAVLNLGIDGNEISADDGGYGQGIPMEQRFKRDVLSQRGARFVLLLGGINDIGESTIALHAHGATPDYRTIAANVIAAQKKIIEEAHAAGLHVIGATLPPFEGADDAYSKAGNEARERINDWIRHYTGFSGVADFDVALRDPAHPARLRPELDSGDHIHPDDAGYAAMAAAVPLAVLGCGQ